MRVSMRVSSINIGVLIRCRVLCHSNEGLFSDESIVYIANSLWVMLPLK